MQYHQLPKQIVTPYKPQDDYPNAGQQQQQQSNNGYGGGTGVSEPLTPSPGPASPMCGPPSAFSINSASSDLSDRAPLLARFGDRGRAGPAAGNYLLFFILFFQNFCFFSHFCFFISELAFRMMFQLYNTITKSCRVHFFYHSISILHFYWNEIYKDDILNQSSCSQSPWSS